MTMAERPTEAELVRFIEGELSAKRANQIKVMIADHPSIAADVDSLRKALAMQDELREAVRDTPGIETERRIENSLVETVTNVIGKTKERGK